MKIYSCECKKHSEKSTDDFIISSLGLYLKEKGEPCGERKIGVYRDQYGKPHIEGADGIYISVTHAESLLLVAVAPYEIGIDAESGQRRAVKNPGRIAKRYFCEDEIAFLGDEPDREEFLCMWVKKEALSKLIGRGVPCMREMSVFSDKVTFEKISEYDGYIVYSVRYSENNKANTI